MKDRFGNPLKEGDSVISSSYSPTAHIGSIIEAVEGRGVKLFSDKGNPIHRAPHTLIIYKGIIP